MDIYCNNEIGCPDRITFAVVITFNPTVDKFRRLLESLRNQVSRIIIVDNSSSNDVRSYVTCSGIVNFEFLALENNLGIAAAANKGAERAISLGATHVVFFDQDSDPAPDMIRHLVMAEQRLTMSGGRVAAVGPLYIEENSSQIAPFIRITNSGYKKFRPCTSEAFIETDFLIFSGSLVSAASLNQIGLMDESLFIDWVDTEWCWRAQSLGYAVYGIPAALMRHTLGEQAIRMFNRKTPLHSPLRHYYLYRNAVLICFRNYIPFRYKFYSCARLFIRLPIYLACANDRIQRLLMIIKGIFHGVKQHSGPYR